ncbi:hypothetical protein FGU46_03885 [Methanobacterium sp. CWC-01]|uniref:Eco57I restriction-modification methylase domain-containing protein n=1 Tax=Methanobacterium aridiramus TaxID=2584467 RepID=UPI0025778781|nr:TaqI-like C-terminal specificity domain-containing protein [Methanobacterium sp. CWC-01]WJI09297.1 hypothetical protein FGU46_03885 [Methanobacterium sp. CWC-01]
MKNDLFNHSLLKKYSSEFKLSPSKHDLIKNHLRKLEEGQFKSETKNYLYFYDIILHKILGYDREENILFDEKEEEGKGKSEFVLKSPEGKFMVVELKDQTTDLDKPQTRKNDKRTPVDQAFDYAQHTGDIEWIMVSNFDEFRLYNWHQKGKYISFKAEELLDKRMYAFFMTSFSLKAYIKEKYPTRLMEKTLVVERELEKEFYKLYNETRLMLMRELEEYNNFVRDGAIHYAQLILNRYMFVSFAEDTGLLPSQVSTDTIITPIQKGNLRHRSIWQRLNELFLDISEGNDYKKISAYNGGLFEEDLDSIQIRDTVDDLKLFEDVWQNWNFEEYERDIIRLMGPNANKVNPIYKNLLTISSFDFSSELDVNILGHIFENSIGDLEELKEDVRGRRKKEGIFYTPEYITDYICRNTIIPYLSKSGNVNTVSDLIGEYWGSAIEELDEKVQNIKIVDPACGSGAFLNKAADVLVEIHQAIHDELYKDKKDTLTPYFDQVGIRREILLNNIYGVDLNEESVDITKLSLFLKVCKKDTKLPALDKNIKCGNSLIDDPEYTDKSFNWEGEFPEIFKDGGFDVVIGNPPYVRQERIKDIKPYLKNNYDVYHGMADLYAYFFEKGLKILKDGGFFSFVCSNKFTRTKNDSNLRKFILDHKFVKYNDYTGKNIFEDVTTNPAVFVIENSFDENNYIRINDEFAIHQNRFDETIWSIQNPLILDLKDKIEERGIKLVDFNLDIYYGIKTGYDKAFIINEETRNHLINQNNKSIELINPLVRGKDLKRYRIEYKDLYIIIMSIGVDIEEYLAIKKYLGIYEDQLRKRHDQGKNWWELRACAYYENFKKEKIMWGNLSIGPNFSYSEEEIYTTAPANILTGKNLKYLLTILNSKITFFIFKLIGVKVDSGYSEWKKNRVEQLPIYPATPKQQQPLIEKADQMLQLNRQLQDEVKGFQDWLQHTFGIEKLSKKLEKYYELSLEEFLEELRKKKVDVKARKNYKTLKDEFEESLAKVQPLFQKIEEIDDEIDRMVYALYELNEDDIGIIEEYLKGH